MTIYEDLVQEFHEAFSHPVGSGDLQDAALLDLRLSLIREEYEEFKTAVIDYFTNPVSENYQDVLKELADLQYVLSGFAVAFGIPIEEAFQRVHQSNMSKLGPNGTPVFSENGKVLKGPFYELPDLEDLAS